ncbi:hypothetical protein IAD21_02401 [Abditibacteriota bacterium]|nr:hypothetical protein IAD21_02401 [Abditibacteriota bacterium]
MKRKIHKGDWVLSNASLFAKWEKNLTAGRLLHYWNKAVFLRPSGEGLIYRDGLIYHIDATRCSLGRCRWSSSRKPQHFQLSPFRFEGGDIVFLHSDEYWLAHIQKWNEAKQSDFSFALRWVDETPEGRAQHLIELEEGNWDELRRIAQLILTLEGHQYCPCNFNEQMTISLKMQYLDEQITLFTETQGRQLITRRASLWDEWLRFFNLALDYDAAEIHAATSQAVREGFSWNYSRLSSRLTQHEHLETLLELRDWLRERVGLSDERITELLA